MNCRRPSAPRSSTPRHRACRNRASRSRAASTKPTSLLGKAPRQPAERPRGQAAVRRWLSAEIEVERALVAEARRRPRRGRRRLRCMRSARCRAEFPGIAGAAGGQGAQGRLPVASAAMRPAPAPFSTRWSTGSTSIADSGTALRDLLGPYFDLLARDGSADAAAAHVPRQRRCCNGRAWRRRRRSSPANMSAGNNDARRCSAWPSAAPARSSAPKPRSRGLSTKPARTAARPAEPGRGQGQPRGAARRPGPAAGQARRLSALQGAGARSRPSSTNCRPRFVRARAITR